MRTIRRWAVAVLVAVLVGLGCKADDRALVLEGLRAGERCAVAFLDDAGRPSKCVAAVVDTTLRALTPASAPDAGASRDAEVHE